MIFFCFLSFSAFPILFLLEKKLWWFFFKFLNIFLYFYTIFYSRSGRNPSERFFLFSLFLSLSLPILAWKEAMMVFSEFLNSFTIILEFSITGRVGTHGNDFFYFLSFIAFPNLIWFEKMLWWCFLIFWIFLLFFWNFLLRVG